jgi:hypothetical protein
LFMASPHADLFQSDLSWHQAKTLSTQAASRPSQGTHCPASNLWHRGHVGTVGTRTAVTLALPTGCAVTTGAGMVGRGVVGIGALGGGAGGVDVGSEIELDAGLSGPDGVDPRD